MRRRRRLARRGGGGDDDDDDDDDAMPRVPNASRRASPGGPRRRSLSARAAATRPGRAAVGVRVRQHRVEDGVRVRGAEGVRRAGVATTVLPGARRDASFSIHHRLAFDRCLHHADRRRRAPQPQPNARYSTVYHPYSFITGLHGSQRHAGFPRQDGHARGVRGRRLMLGRRVQDLPERRPRGSRSFRDPGKAIRSADLSSPPRRRLGRRPRRRRERADVRRDGAREQPELAGTRAGR